MMNDAATMVDQEHDACMHVVAASGSWNRGDIKGHYPWNPLLVCDDNSTAVERPSLRS